MQKMKSHFHLFLLFEAFKNKERQLVYVESRDRLSINKTFFCLSSDLNDRDPFYA